MRGYQASFSSGEISPLLHGRIDLSKYATGLSRLENMIVLPQGGVTRRAGFSMVGTYAYNNAGVKLIPFEYSATDSAVIVFGDNYIQVLGKTGDDYEVKSLIGGSPYTKEEISDLRYVQSGNVIFIAHPSHPPMMLKRESANQWTLKALEYRNGPLISGSEWSYGAKLRVSGQIVRSTHAIFSEGLVGSLLSIEYSVEASTYEITSETVPVNSEIFEVKGTLNITTSGEWEGTITIKRSSDGGENWVKLKEYKRQDKETQGQWDITITETEENILYRVSAQHTEDSPNASEVMITTSSYVKREIFEITGFLNWTEVTVKRQDEISEKITEITQRISTRQTGIWSIGAWGNVQGYPRAVTLHQDRLIFAGSQLQPQTLWMSRTGDYADFGTSDPLRDDDAVNITLGGVRADGIHSLLSAGRLIAFTSSGEWQIRGNTEGGAISASGVSAEESTALGSKDIQPMKVNGRIIMIQAQGQKVYALGYDLNTDGYAGSELSVMSGHIFEGKEIISMAYQKTPDSLLWFALNDGTAAVCTYNPEHEVIGWSRQNSPSLKFLSFQSIPSTDRTELFSMSEYERNNVLVRLKDRRTSEDYRDNGTEYESILETLRISDAGNYASKKLIARLSVYALDSVLAWAAPKDWERRQRVVWEETEGLREAELELDSGFEEGACIQLRNYGNNSLTIAAISPSMTMGG